jgi:hypothetical protein
MKTYADFFEWPDKPRKELGVVERLLGALGPGWHSPRIQQPDPPDCVCLDSAGGRIGIEVVEVVCAEATARTARGESVMRLWAPGEITEHIRGLLAKKDTRNYLGGPYKQLVACLFTDEFDLDFEEVRAELADTKFGPLTQLSAAYLVFSYDSHTQTCPLLELKVHQ